MPPETGVHDCKQEGRISRLESGFEYFIKRTADHIAEGDKVGGYRDRILLLETEDKAQSDRIGAQTEIISALKKAEWKRVIVGGVIGGIIARSPELIGIARHFIGVLGF